MESQGYPEWKNCLYEHFVRAGEVLIAERMRNKKEADDLRRQYTDTRKFIYLPVIITELEAYTERTDMHYYEAVINAMEKLKIMAAEIRN